MTSKRLKLAQEALSSITDATTERLPLVVTDPLEFASRVSSEVEKYPSAVPWGLAGAGAGFLAGVPITRGLWRGGKAFMQSDLANSMDAAVRRFSQTAPARIFSSKGFGLGALRPVSKRTAPLWGGVLGGGAAYDVGRQRAEEDKFGPPPSNAPYVYIPMQ